MTQVKCTTVKIRQRKESYARTQPLRPSYIRRKRFVSRFVLLTPNVVKNDDISLLWHVPAYNVTPLPQAPIYSMKLV